MEEPNPRHTASEARQLHGLKHARPPQPLSEAALQGDDGLVPEPTGTSPSEIDGTPPRGPRRRRTTRRSLDSSNVVHAFEETEAVAQLCRGVLAQAGIFWTDVAHPLWLPLLGLLTLGTAFTVPMWLAIPEILTGMVLVHIKAWQDWVQITCQWGGKSCQVLNVERAGAVTAVLLGAIALLYRVGFSGAGHFAVFDLISMAFSIGGAASAWCKPSGVPAPKMREVPATALLILFLAIATLAPAPGLASLPYALLFLALLAVLVCRCGLSPLSFTVRLCLLLMTSCHIIALLVLSFWGPGAPEGFIDVFGLVGRAVSSNVALRAMCAFKDDSRAACVPGSQDIFWPGAHVTSLLLLHFVLSNISCSKAALDKEKERSSSPTGDVTELTTEDGLGAKAWTKAAIRWGIFANLVLVVVWFPNLMNLPMLFMSFSLTVEKSGVTRLMCRCLRYTGRCIRCRCRTSTDPEEAELVHWKGRYVCIYMTFVFLVSYLYNISQGDLPGRPKIAKWLNETLHLQESVPVASQRTWFECIGLEYYGSIGAAHAAAAFFPQAVVLAVVAWLQAILDDPHAPRARACQMIGKVMERLWFLVASVMVPEVSMVVVLCLSTFMLECEDGMASVILVTYTVLLVTLMLSKKLIRAQLWLVLQVSAELASILLVFIYVINPTMELQYPFSKFVTVKCKKLPVVIAPHLGVALTVGMQRLAIAEANGSKALRRRTSTGDSMTYSDGDESLHSVGAPGVKLWTLCFQFLDRKAIRRMKLFFEEMIVLGVMILSLVTTLLPPVDVHSLALLAVVGPALLIYNFEDDRERLLLGVLQLLQCLTAAFLLCRMVAASPLVPLPKDNTWLVSLQELGMIRPARDVSKLVFLGLVTILTRVAIKEARTAIIEIDEIEAEMVAAEGGVGGQPAIPGVAPPAGVQSDTMPDSPPEDIPASQPADLMATHAVVHGDGLDFREGDEMVRPTHRPGFFGTVTRKRNVSLGFAPKESSASSVAKKKNRRDMRRNRGPRWEERMMMKWAPGWLPLKPHAYISALLLIMSFAVSITEVHLLNFLMITAVVSLCGWYELWVQAGNVFSVTTVGIMLLQYVARFKLWDGLINENWVRGIGLAWSANQVVRHCSILSLCLLQKQLWHRGRYSKPRAPLCPKWLSRHADLVGMAALLLVAVARRHVASPLLAAAALPWLLREEWEDLHIDSLARIFAKPGHIMTRSWLRFFRLILVLTLMSQIVMRLLVEFNMEDEFDVFFNWSCSYWEGDVTVAPNVNATKMEPTLARLECIQEWRTYCSMENFSSQQLLWEFLALFILGMVQQLFERVEPEDERSEETHRWKLVVMHWWICLVYALTFALSLEGGTLLGIGFLVLLFGVTFSSSGNLAKRRRWVWRTQLAAWVCLFIGLVAQSPMLPCSRASCHGQVHRTFLPHSVCLILQDANTTTVENEQLTSTCEGTVQGSALGHDTFNTLAVRAAGFRRIGGHTFWEDVGVILGSQLGTLLQLILAASVQIRICNSTTYRQKVDEHFIDEPRSLYIERARRYVHEFYCRCRIEEMSSRERRRALRDKLKRVMRKINEILGGRASDGSNIFKEVTRDLVVEELQLSHGVKKEVAREVTSMFYWDMSLSKEYLDMLHLVTLGRLQPDSSILERNFERLQQSALKGRFSTSSRGAQITAKQVARMGSMQSAPPAPSATFNNSGSSLQARNKARWKNFQTWANTQANHVSEYWETLTKSKHIGRWLYDYAFLCTDEIKFTLRPASAAAHEELDEHRRSNGPFRILWKAALSNMAPLVAVSSVLAFVETRSILDVIRGFAVFFVALHRYPFPPKELWRALLAYNVFILVLRTFYDLPMLCAGPALRTRVPEGQQPLWEPSDVLLWCPAVTRLDWDITFGVAKRRGASSLTQTSWFWAVWADHLCVWTVLLHQWMLVRSGLWDHVTYDQESKQVFLLASPGQVEGKRENAISGDSGPLPIAMRGPKARAVAAKTRAVEHDIDFRHKAQVKSCIKVRDQLLSEYYQMLAKEGPRVRRNSESQMVDEPSQPEMHEEADPGEQPPSVIVSLDDSPQRGRARDEGSFGGLSRGSHASSSHIMGPGSSTHMLPGHHWHFKGVSRVRNQLRGRVTWMLPGEHSHHALRAPEECELYCYVLDGTDEQVNEKLKALKKIQAAVRRFLERRKKHRRIRCLMGHPLQKEEDVLFELMPSPLNRKASSMDQEIQVCERCSKVITSTVRYSCKDCDYHACKDCVQMLLALDQGMGKQDGVREKNDSRPGIAVYWLKYLLGLVLLVYFMVANTQIFTQEATSTIEAVQANNISSHTLLLLSVHLALLITDRIFHKWHYRSSDHHGSLRLIEFVNLVFLLSEFIWVHQMSIQQLRNASNLRQVQLPLSSEPALCLYYLGWMTYLGVCIAQRKYGLPAVDHDTLRPTAPPDSFGILMEKFYTFSWYFHYALPFVDDLRVIIDWSVMPTSLDLWMHFKVEDAHSWLFRTRHTMYVRRQSFFAEQRDACEKVYSGWLIVLLLVFIILMPLLIFSPITPFNTSVDIEDGEATFKFGVATACVEGTTREECRFKRILLYQATPVQIVKYNASRKTSYLESRPTAPSTDIDVQEVEWPVDSMWPVQVSRPVGTEVQEMLTQNEYPVMAYFHLKLHLQRENQAPGFDSQHVVCFCKSLAGECSTAVWPRAAAKVCGGSYQGGTQQVEETAQWWASIGRGDAWPWDKLDNIWENKIRVGTTGANLLGQESSLLYRMANCSNSCKDAWCSYAQCWGSLELADDTSGQIDNRALPGKVVYELERSATLNSLTTSSSSFSVVGLYLAVVLVAGRYLRAAFQDSSKRAIYEEIPDVGGFLDLVTAIKLAREHRDLRTEFQLYYCLMKVFRSTNLLLTTGGHEPTRYGAGRSDEQPPECEEPKQDQPQVVEPPPPDLRRPNNFGGPPPDSSPRSFSL